MKSLLLLYNLVRWLAFWYPLALLQIFVPFSFALCRALSGAWRGSIVELVAIQTCLSSSCEDKIFEIDISFGQELIQASELRI